MSILEKMLHKWINSNLRRGKQLGTFFPSISICFVFENLPNHRKKMDQKISQTYIDMILEVRLESMQYNVEKGIFSRLMTKRTVSLDLFRKDRVLITLKE